jgi:hypothetical protein
LLFCDWSTHSACQLTIIITELLRYRSASVIQSTDQQLGSRQEEKYGIFGTVTGTFHEKTSKQQGN